MNITILGAGAIGSLWAHHLANAGHNVSLWLRHSNTSSLTLTLFEDNEIASTSKYLEKNKQACNEFFTNNLAQLKASDLILITVKAWQVEQALTPILDHLIPETILVFMHNGMGAVDELPEQVDRHPIVVATTTHGAYKPSNDQVLHTGVGMTMLGGNNLLGKQCHFLADVFDHALASASWTGSIQTALWHKLAINCVINPLTALHQCLNGALLNYQYTAQIQTIVAELCAVMQAEKIVMTEQNLFDRVINVVKATANNHSSMQQDIVHQRRTEIDYINGYLCRTARQHQINVPANQDLYSRIKTIEQSWS
ncbi:2-dehydropantoate 2-reductase [Vibrio sp. TH_r3]|uniref:2-dehydropantoate 2-reductase n=1 Tax=Vibrio sp. TH_r3 TaxID=3082084 RepID=UPI002954D803|nr:2-dehydropantoate 2-reductase [Vibrio sp. TH_r3]MDV7104745.1 2-dehydropantoate 2-reductase [Vibrio sp. TH_r3]